MNQDFGATTPNIPIPRPEDQTTGRPTPGVPPPPVNPRAPQQTPPKRGIPLWVWGLIGGVILLLSIAVAVVIYFMIQPSGFTLIVKEAPPGSVVFVDNKQIGITKGDGTIVIPGLKSGRRLLRVSHEGFEDFNDSVLGKDGDKVSKIVQLISKNAKPVLDKLPTEINYNGSMMLVQAGEFIMGDDDHLPDEKPTHKVTLPDFYIDKFEITNAQYKKFCDETNRKLPTNPWWAKQFLNTDNYFTSKPDLPVVGVTWNDALAYAKWAGKRLPTEEEWEKAASWDPGAGKKRQWPWGDSSEPGRANLDKQKQSPVAPGQHPNGVSAYGVHDLSGNVAEWVESIYKPYGENQPSGAQSATNSRVVRGGSFISPPNEARTTRRYQRSPDFTAKEKQEGSWLIGFRCAVLANDPKLQEHLKANK
jgi:formylglycine-generating enzyme